MKAIIYLTVLLIMGVLVVGIQNSNSDPVDKKMKRPAVKENPGVSTRRLLPGGVSGA